MVSLQDISFCLALTTFVRYQRKQKKIKSTFLNKGVNISSAQTAMGLPPGTSIVLILNNFGKTWAFGNIRNASATPSGIKREWYVCMYGMYVVLVSRRNI
jgi:hypothetical protein